LDFCVGRNKGKGPLRIAEIAKSRRRARGGARGGKRPSSLLIETTRDRKAGKWKQEVFNWVKKKGEKRKKRGGWGGGIKGSGPSFLRRNKRSYLNKNLRNGSLILSLGRTGVGGKVESKREIPFYSLRRVFLWSGRDDGITPSKRRGDRLVSGASAEM